MLRRWDEAIAIAESKNRPETDELKTSYFQWLLETSQEEKAAQLKEQAGEIETAIRLYLQGGLPARAAALAQNPDYPQPPVSLSLTCPFRTARIVMSDAKVGDHPQTTSVQITS